MCIGGHHDLSEIRRIGKYFLVAGHAGIKTDLAGSSADLACSFAIKYSTISQQQYCGQLGEVGDHRKKKLNG